MLTWWNGVSLLSAAGIILGLTLLVRRPDPERREPRQTRGNSSHLLVWLADRLARAGWSSVNPSTAILLWGVGVVSAGAIVFSLIPIPALWPLASLATLFAGRSLLRSRIAARERALRQAWPGIVDHLRSAVRSGASVGEAVILVTPRVPREFHLAFSSFCRELEAGTRVDSALAMLKANLAHPVADRIIESLRMAHEVGGRELPRVLEALQSSVRADISLREDAIAKQSWIRAASRLGVAAPWLVLLVLSGRQETIEAYQSLSGNLIILLGALLSAVAFRVMSRLGVLPEEGRWFAQ